MARGGYRQQGSDQAVRLVYRPGLGLTEIKILTLGGIALSAILLLVGTRTFGLPILVALLVSALLTLAVTMLVTVPFRRAHDVIVEPGIIRLRSRHFPGFWSEQCVVRGEVRRLDRVNAWGTVNLRLAMRTGEPIPLFKGLGLDTDTAERMGEALDRALDPDQIDDLADEHRGKDTTVENL